MTSANANLWKSVAQSTERDKPSSVQVNPEGWPILDRVKSDFGVGKADFVTRLLLWFDRQEPRVQLELLRPDGDPVTELVTAKLAELSASGKAPATSIEDACRLIKSLATRIEQAEKARQREFGARPPKK